MGDLRPIVLFSPNPWDFHKQRGHHLAEAFARHTDTYFVPLGVEILAEKTHLPAALAAHLLGGSVRVSTTGTGVGLVRMLHQVPLGNLLHRAACLNQRRLEAALAAWSSRLPQSPVVWLQHAPALPLAQLLKPDLIIYDCVDVLGAFPYPDEAARQLMLRHEATAVAAADAVVVVTPPLAPGMQDLGAKRVKLIRNAGNASDFPRRASVDRGAQPIIGFAGGIAEAIDFDAVRSVAEALPAARVEMVGPVYVDVPPLPRNVQFVGQVPYEALPAMIELWDLALIPFRLYELTEPTDPLKLYEYLAAGKPVLSTPLPEVERLGSLVNIALASQFGAVARSVLEADTPADAERRRTWALTQTWDERASQALRLIEELLAERAENTEPRETG